MKNKKILLVDDDEIIRNEFDVIFSTTEYKLDSAKNSIEALEKIKNINYDLVLLDIRMPNIDNKYSETAGIELLENVLKIKPNIPVIMVSAVKDLNTAVKAIKIGAKDYVEKDNLTNEELIKKIKDALKPKKLPLDKIIYEEFPTPISIIYREIRSNISSGDKFRRLIDLFELWLKTITIILISEYFSGKERKCDFERLLYTKIATPSLGIWFDVALLLQELDLQNGGYYKNKIQFIAHKDNKSYIEDFIRLRNDTIGHGARLVDSEYENLLNMYLPRIEKLLECSYFYSINHLYSVINSEFKKGEVIHNVKILKGTEGKFLPRKISLPYSSTVLIAGNFPLIRAEEVYIICEQERYSISLYPFIVLKTCPRCQLEKLFVFRKYQEKKFHFIDYEYGHSLTSMECFMKFYENIFNLSGVLPEKEGR